MRLHVTRIILSNAPLKIVSLILGFACWYIISQYQTVTILIPVSLCFDDVSENVTVYGPELVHVTITGKRIDLYALDKDQLAAHINVRGLSTGTHGIELNAGSLFLPSTIKLVHYNPSNIVIEITMDESKNDTV